MGKYETRYHIKAASCASAAMKVRIVECSFLGQRTWSKWGMGMTHADREVEGQEDGPEVRCCEGESLS